MIIRMMMIFQVSSVYGEGNDDYVSQEEQKKQEEMQRPTSRRRAS